MTAPQTWMVRAGRGGRFFDQFRERSIVAIRWAELGDLSGLHSRAELLTLVRRSYPAESEQALKMSLSQVRRFLLEFSEGDRVITYDPGARKYLCGEIIGPYTFHPEASEELRNQRNVKWGREVARDSLSSGARNALGALSTIFLIPSSVSAELWGESSATARLSSADDESDVAVATPRTSELTDEDILSLASEAIKDRIARLSWQEMQELVAGLLRAMGYKTTVSPAGPDRGKDIVASPDGFGFQEPRIVVEVKHRRTERMGSQEIRSFLGGRHQKDKGLYVSTGGFSADAHYEAERASIPLTLMDFESLVAAILEHYPALDEETKQILPLKRLYWPLSK